MQRRLTLSFSAQCRRVVEIFNPLTRQRHNGRVDVEEGSSIF